MAGLLGPTGRPISSEQYKKADPPKTGPAFGAWAGRDVTYATLPGGGIVQFDLSKLTLTDYRAMKDHYQVNSSLSVLDFMLHQSDYKIECDDKDIRDFCQENIDAVWTNLCRSMGQAHWAGYSPNALEWENDGPRLRLNKVKDLIPEECIVNWKEVEGWAPPGRVRPKFKIYDGIKQYGVGWPIPVDNSFWYPMLMENGDYYGRKILRPAFQSWFFSILIHLFANRYYERFGEPTPVGRAPFDDQMTLPDGTTVRGSDYMLSVLQDLRNRSVVVLPNDVTDMGNGQRSFDYMIEYLESQMRGADFERYLTRLDEEISLAIFTPILLMRTADVGSYNLGVGHMQLWLWMLNAINGDRKTFLDKYILRPMKNYNFSPNAPKVEIKFRKTGNTDTELIRTMITELIRGDKAMPDLETLGQMAGLDLKKVRQLTQPPVDPNATDPNATTPPDPRVGRTRPEKKKGAAAASKAVLGEVLHRVKPQVENAFREHLFGPDFEVSMGYKHKLERALEEDGHSNVVTLADRYYQSMDRWLDDAVALEYSGPDDFMTFFGRVLELTLDQVIDAP